MPYESPGFMQPNAAPYESSSLQMPNMNAPMPNMAAPTMDNNMPPIVNPYGQGDCGCGDQVPTPYAPQPGMYGAPHYPAAMQAPYYQPMPYYRPPQPAIFGSPDTEDDDENE